MNTCRNIKKLVTAHATIEGAGVRLQRAIGFDDPYRYDPFLLLDDFRSDTPSEYIKGFPWHPHRGIETITYVLEGAITHEDSIGNRGSIENGAVQWMTAGSGIYHQEMPEGDKNGSLSGFQVWANLPARYKMMEPRYREIKAENIPEVNEKNGVCIKIIAGTYENTTGPVTDVVTSPEYYDVFIPAQTEYLLHTKKENTVIFYIFAGEGTIVTEGDKSEIPPRNTKVMNRTLLLFGEGDVIKIKTAKESLRFLLLAGKPLKEPIAWYGPIVMNNDEELRTAYEELSNGTFVKQGKQ
ncbi:MAG: pirin family protein [Treponema sp.]|jgi:redox-sensitive bicupin YhaK (pirin superfamily)|nr:pirin family protein [Treponema sp.]